MAAAPLMPGDAYPPKDRGTGGSPPTLVARVRGLERLALAHAGVVVAARVGRAGEADLVPGVCVGVQRRAGAPGPQAPHVRGVQLVPVAGFQVLYGLDQGHLVRARRAGERRRPDRPGCLARPGRCLAVLGHVRVASAVGLRGRQPGVDHLQDGDAGLVFLAREFLAREQLEEGPRTVCSAGWKNASGGGAASRGVTSSAVTWSQCRAWLMTSTPGNRSVAPARRRWAGPKPGGATSFWRGAFTAPAAGSRRAGPSRRSW
jgi:hypothetical protein